MSKLRNKEKQMLCKYKGIDREYVFLDLEFNIFTNDEQFKEITSIGAVKCDKNFDNIECFHIYVKPISYEKITSNPEYKAFYTMNNKIIPDKGESLSVALDKFFKWLGDNNESIYVWGSSDIPVLTENIEALGLGKSKNVHMLDRLINIQPELSSNVKVLDSVVNYSISLEYMKKLYSIRSEVTHNALLDSIDLMNIYMCYKNNKKFNKDALCELSYVYRYVDTSFQLEKLKQEKIKNNFNFLNSRNISLEKSSIVENNLMDNCSMENKVKFLRNDSTLSSDSTLRNNSTLSDNSGVNNSSISNTNDFIVNESNLNSTLNSSDLNSSDMSLDNLELSTNDSNLSMFNSMNFNKNVFSRRKYPKLKHMVFDKSLEESNLNKTSLDKVNLSEGYCKDYFIDNNKLETVGKVKTTNYISPKLNSMSQETNFILQETSFIPPELMQGKNLKIDNFKNSKEKISSSRRNLINANKALTNSMSIDVFSTLEKRSISPNIKLISQGINYGINMGYTENILEKENIKNINRGTLLFPPRIDIRGNINIINDIKRSSNTGIINGINIKNNANTIKNSADTINSVNTINNIETINNIGVINNFSRPYSLNLINRLDLIDRLGILNRDSKLGINRGSKLDVNKNAIIDTDLEVSMNSFLNENKKYKKKQVCKKQDNKKQDNKKQDIDILEDQSFDGRLVLENPSANILGEVLMTLEKCNFKYKNICPKFKVIQEDDVHALMFNNIKDVNKDISFNIAEDECIVDIKDNKIKLTLKKKMDSLDGNTCGNIDALDGNYEIECLKILSKYMRENARCKIEKELFLSSKLYQDIEIDLNNLSSSSFLNRFFKIGNFTFSNNIQDISFLENKMFVKRRKEDNAIMTAKHNINTFIKNSDGKYSLMINYRASDKKTINQQLFNIPDTKEAQEIVEKLLEINKVMDTKKRPKMIAVDRNIKRAIISLVDNKGLKSKYKASVYSHQNGLTFLRNNRVETINLNNASMYILSDGIRNTLFIKNMSNEKTYEFKLFKAKNTAKIIDALFRAYRKNKPETIKIQMYDIESVKLLSALKEIKEFKESNSYTYKIMKDHVCIRKNIKNELQDEVYSAKDFKVFVNITNNYNISVKIMDTNSNKIFASCVSVIRFSSNEMFYFLRDIDKLNYLKSIYENLDVEVKENMPYSVLELINANMLNDYDKYSFKGEEMQISHLSRKLLNMLGEVNNRNLIVCRDRKSRLEIKSDCIKIKRNKFSRSTTMQCEEVFLEINIAKEFINLKIYDEYEHFYYAIKNTQKNRFHFIELFNLIKDEKSKSWINIDNINTYVKNSIWRVLENSNAENTFVDKCVGLNKDFNVIKSQGMNTDTFKLSKNYFQVGKRKYMYQNTQIALKNVDNDKIILQIGQEKANRYSININNKNKLFVDDLINCGMIYGKAQMQNI